MQFQSIKAPVVYAILLSISLSVFVLYIVGAAHYLTDHEENTCDMTYMFEYPQYVRIRLISKNDDVSEDYVYPRYGLFAYGEGFVTERLRRMHFTGIPVLFIPGNAGSHEQVRSLASISLRKSLKSRTPFHFDYFTISFGKDYSALYGGVLKKETEYVAKCIQRILSLYQGKVKNIILIGHSMGGIIAKGALLLVPEINSNVASILLTLATPHKPSVFPDYTFLNYYQELTSSMASIKENGTTVISIGGGPRDILVPSSQTIDQYADINTLTTSIPGVWRSTDHLCILWCKQLIMNIVRSLFDCVDTSQKPAVIYESHEQRIKSFNWHFAQRFSMEKRLPRTVYKEKVEFAMNEESEWIEDMRRQYVWSSKNYTYSRNKSKKPTTIYLMFRVNAPIDTLSIDAIHLRNSDWIFACSASSIRGQSRICTWGWNLSNRTRIIPGSTRKPFKYSIDLDLNEIRTLAVSHVIVRIPDQTVYRYDDDDENDDDDDDNQIIQVDAYTRAARYKRISNGKSWSSDRGNLRYYVALDGITDAVSVEFKNSNCTENSYFHYSIVELSEPWVPGSGQMQFIAENEDSPKILKLQTVHSQRLRMMKQQSAELKLSLDPACSYNIHVQRANLVERIACMVRDRWTFIYPIIIGLLLLSIGQRIDFYNEDRTSILAITIITIILTASLNLVLECCVGIAILHILAIAVCCCVVFFGSVAHNIAVRFLARAVTFSTTWSDWLLGGIVNQLPIVAAGVLLSMIPATCGGLAMLLSIFLHFLRLTRMYEDYLEELLLASMRHFNLLKKRDKNNQESGDSVRQNIFNQVLLFLFWCFAALPAVPSTLVWAKNFSFSTRLINEDQVLLYSWIVMVTCGTSGLVQIPKSSVNSYKTKMLATLLRCLGWIALAISATSNTAYYYWCFPPCLAIVVVLISLNSLQA
ncbi:GPI inositol-deacylase [Nasonia vitripennis]|uniref:GPI inositol-deacylase n=1 Tax=Nasonia vitripennis TaxID=7425 RepID=A0A7M7LUQ3_NASVI|nr:GPI inositol-deacylase [Nasonia vitripennis]